MHPYATSLANLGFVYRHYDRLMQHWRKTLDLEMLEVVYEEVIADPETWSRRIIDFCGLPWNDACLRFHESGRRVVTLSYDQVRKPVYDSSRGRAERFGDLLDELRAALEAEPG
jgi:hypothetical protein